MISIIILCHSFYLNGLRVNLVRLVADSAAISTCVFMVLIMSCMWTSCSLWAQELMYTVVGLNICSSVSLSCDNLATFALYSIVNGKTSSKHKRFAAIWSVGVISAPFFWFYAIGPALDDMNSPEWTLWVGVLNLYIFPIAYFLFDAFYLVSFLHTIHKYRGKTSLGNTMRNRLAVLGVKAVLHTLSSMVAMILFSFVLPVNLGLIVYNLCIMISLHLFVNCTLWDGYYLALIERSSWWNAIVPLQVGDAVHNEDTMQAAPPISSTNRRDIHKIAPEIDDFIDVEISADRRKHDEIVGADLVSGSS